MDVRFGPRAAFTFDVAGTVDGHGRIRGEITPVGTAKAPLGGRFEGTRTSAERTPPPQR